MKTNNLKHIAYLATATLLFGACSGPKVNSFRNGGLFGLTAANSNSQQDEDAKDLEAYISIDVQPDETIEKMNTRKLNELVDGKPNPAKQARQITVSGIVIEMDASKPPFNSYTCADAEKECIYNLSALTVEASKIVIKGTHQLRQTTLKLIANEIVFENDGVLDVTPLGYQQDPEPMDPNSTDAAGNNGDIGEAAPKIQLFSENVTIHGDLNKPRVIANGGPGQKGGLGKNGVDGVSYAPIAILGKQSQNGVEYDIVYRSHLRYYHEKSCWGAGWRFKCGETEVVYHPMGADQWPGNGGNATPGGFPGAGGAGGFVEWKTNSINDQAPTVDVVKALSQTLAGTPGASAGVFKGGAAGTPVNAAKLRGVNNNSDSATFVTEFNTSIAGQDAMSPDQPQSAQPTGQVSLETTKNLPFSAAFFKNRLRFIREQYLNRDFAKVDSILKKDIQNMSARVSTQSITELNAVLAKFSVLQSQLRLSQDYFGHALDEAPLYALDFNINQFEAEVNIQLQSYFLTEKILKLIEVQQSTHEALKQTVRHYNSVIAYESTQTNVKSAKVNDLEVQAKSVKNQETAYNDLLMELNRQVEERAKNSLDFKHRADQIRQSIKVLASLSKVIPAGQPMLAAGGTLLEVVANPPENGSVEEWITYLSKTKSSMENLTDPKTLAESRKSLNDFIDSLRVSNLDGKTTEEKITYLKKLNDDLGPTFKKMQEIAQGFNQSVVSNEELQDEINRIKATDPLFVDVTNRLQELLKEKIKLNTTLQELTKGILESSAVINTALNLSIVSSNEYLQSTNYGNTLLKDLMMDIQNKSEERLLYIYSEVLKGYEYTSLERVTFKNNFQIIKEATLDLIQKGMTPEQAQPVLNTMYMGFINTLLTSLDKKFHQTDPVILLKNDAVSLVLTQDQVSHLNAQGITKLQLDRSIYGSHQRNVRIKSINIESAEFTKNDLPGPSDKTQKSFIRITHGGSGIIEDLESKPHFYTYPNAKTIHSWGSSFQFISGGIQETVISRDESVKGLLGLLIKDKSNTLLYSPIFSQPAGIAELVVEKSDIGPVMSKLSKLQIRVTYTFTE